MRSTTVLRMHDMYLRIKTAGAMEKLIDINAYPIRTTLKILLQDKTTRQNIIWATDAYAEKGT